MTLKIAGFRPNAPLWTINLASFCTSQLCLCCQIICLSPERRTLPQNGRPDLARESAALNGFYCITHVRDTWLKPKINHFKSGSTIRKNGKKIAGYQSRGPHSYRSYRLGYSQQSYLDPFIFLSILACRNQHCVAWIIFQIITNVTFQNAQIYNCKLAHKNRKTLDPESLKNVTKEFDGRVLDSKTGCRMFWNKVFFFFKSHCVDLCGVFFYHFLLLFDHIWTSVPTMNVKSWNKRALIVSLQ